MRAPRKHRRPCIASLLVLAVRSPASQTCSELALSDACLGLCPDAHTAGGTITLPYSVSPGPGTRQRQLAPTSERCCPLHSSLFFYLPNVAPARCVARYHLPIQREQPQHSFCRVALSPPPRGPPHYHLSVCPRRCWFRLVVFGLLPAPARTTRPSLAFPENVVAALLICSVIVTPASLSR